MAEPSPCRRCGSCCRAISLDHDETALRELAARERARLERDPYLPQRAEIERLQRDVRFIETWFRRVDRAHAVRLQPAFASPDFDGRTFYVCTALGAGGACTRHAERPFLCEGYPWYGSAPAASLLVVRPCGYEDVLSRRAAPGR